MQIPVIDMWSPIVPSQEIMAHAANHFPEPQLGYLSVFFGQNHPSSKTFAKLAHSMTSDDATILASLDEANITRSLITGFNESKTGGTHFITNESVAAIFERHPKRFLPFCGVDIMEEKDALQKLEYWIIKRNFLGLSLRPFMIGLPANNRKYYPFYEKCVELDIPISIHASANWTTCRPSELGHPRYFDQVACDFPNLKLILSHAGYPWVLEACLLAWKHKNVYLELAAHRPKYFTLPAAGWAPLLHYGQTTIQDKILYGTGAFLIGTPPKKLVDEMCAISLRPGIMKKWLYDNATKLLGLSKDMTTDSV